jgi:hypothetical protein
VALQCPGTCPRAFQAKWDFSATGALVRDIRMYPFFALFQPIDLAPHESLQDRLDLTLPGKLPHVLSTPAGHRTVCFASRILCRAHMYRHTRLPNVPPADILHRRPCERRLVHISTLHILTLPIFCKYLSTALSVALADRTTTGPALHRTDCTAAPHSSQWWLRDFIFYRHRTPLT